ncbi:LytTR family DNA-binding domain-containing protein [Sphingomonas sp. ID1715]|uniref:LytTR family DNA-binding domain-containing protein n=1 Tax=Sphingomonas sp. ID1715 TaxID=1656898 RepID=UPI001C2CBC40|nr:LytTR family DNA-binding domain-containing protein [Sphingomonas sp. ID1715]
MQLAKRQRPQWLHQLGAALLIGIILGVLGPFGSSAAMSLIERYAFWIASTLAGLLSLRGAEALLGRRLFAARLWRPVVLAALSALPMTFFVAWMFTLLQPGRVFPPGRLLALYLCVTLVQFIIAQALKSGMTARAEPELPTQSLLHSRLPRMLGDKVIALEAEDHYLRVHRPTGSELMLMRLADAVAADDGQQGMQVHRSWWVSRDAVQRWEGGRLHLSNGLAVPVGRTFAARVRASFPR